MNEEDMSTEMWEQCKSVAAIIRITRPYLSEDECLLMAALDVQFSTMVLLEASKNGNLMAGIGVISNFTQTIDHLVELTEKRCMAGKSLKDMVDGDSK